MNGGSKRAAQLLRDAAGAVPLRYCSRGRRADRTGCRRSCAAPAVRKNKNSAELSNLPENSPETGVVFVKEMSEILLRITAKNGILREEAQGTSE